MGLYGFDSRMQPKFGDHGAFKMNIEIPNMGITAYIARENAFYLAISFFILATILNVLRNFSLLEWNCVFMNVRVFSRNFN